jgi:transcriptional regulator GlxA family with amidase domain
MNLAIAQHAKHGTNKGVARTMIFEHIRRDVQRQFLPNDRRQVGA